MTADRGEFATLLEGVRNGSQDAAWELVELYGPHIQRAVRRTLTKEIRSKFDSQDFVQAVWASFFLRPARFARINNPEQLIALLAAMARHKTIDEIRKRMKTQKHDVARERMLGGFAARVAHQLESREPTPSQVAMAREQWESLLRGQPENCRRIVQLRLSGETYLSIARKVGVSQRTVQRVLVRLLRSKVA
jgi:RNA polymerase sigma factor (sigma-70 family)